MSIDAKAFRQALGNYPTGVTVVTTTDSDGTPRGLTANSFTSVSLDPALVLVCLGKTTASHPVFMQAEHFAVNILAEDQRDISGLFASKAPDKFSQAAWQRGATGAPLIDGCVAWFDCTVHQRVDAGDHTILIGQVQDMGQRTARPLGYAQGAYVGFQLAQAAQEAASAHQALTAALIETPQGVLLSETDAGLDLPTDADVAALLSALEQQGIHATVDFVFSVFDTPKGSRIVYRGRAAQAPDVARLRYVPVDQLTSLELADAAVQSMLTRYANERHQDTFGVYIGNQDSGEVRTLATA